MSSRLQVHTSNRVEALVDALATLFEEAPASPFQHDTVVVHSRGFERWIGMELAQRLGICANLWFPFPDELVARCAHVVLGESVDLEVWTARRLTWALLDALDAELDADALAPIRAYFDAGHPVARGRRRWQLAQASASLFERYALYRPALVATWSGLADCVAVPRARGIRRQDAPAHSTGRPLSLPSPGGVAAGSSTPAAVQRALKSDLGRSLLQPKGEDAWDAALWRRCASSQLDLATAVERIGAALSGGDRDLTALGARVAVFSVTTLPPLYLRLLDALSRWLPVHVFALAPSEGLWSQISAARGRLVGLPELPRAQELRIATVNPLLRSMGQLARDFQVGLESLPRGYELASSGYVEPGVDTLLRRIQTDLLHDRPPRRQVLRQDDDSVQIHSCHGALRQVEVLREVLLSLLEDPTLEPRDIIVMAPDIETLAPLVEAVFSEEPEGREGDGPPALPWSIGDRGVRQSNPAAHVLLSLLELARSRMDAPSVLDLLAQVPVRERFGIAEDELPQIREWVVGAGVRWGADAAYRARFEQAPTDEYTWRLGLDRLLVGQAALDPDDMVLGATPHGEIEAMDGRTLLGRFADYVETLLQWVPTLVDARSMGGWRRSLVEALGAMASFPGEHQVPERRVVDGLDELAEHAAAAGFDKPLDLHTVHTMLSGRFDSREPGRGFLTGGVTFCQLVPMRAIPFRVVCLLGMDDGAFPRATSHLGFDRIAREPRMGDRSTREDDRALFLEAICSARDHLIITYSGRRSEDDGVRPPAVPVSELTDLVDAMVGDATAIWQQHPLHAFGVQEFQPQPGRAGRPFSHDTRQLAAARAWASARRDPERRPPFFSQPLSPLQPPLIRLDRLVAFFQAPIKSLLNRRLDVWWRDAEDEVLAREPVEWDALQDWKVRDRLVARLLSGVSAARLEPDALLTWLRAANLLPLGVPGDVVFEERLAEARAIAGAVEERRAGARLPSVDVSRAFEGVRVEGRVADVYPGGHVTWRAGSVRSKHKLALWIEHLAACAAGWQGESVTVGKGKPAIFGAVPPDLAVGELHFLVDAYVYGQAAPLLFFPQACETWWWRVKGAPGSEQAEMRAADAVRERSWGRRYSDEPSPYTRRVLGRRCPYDHPMPLDDLVFDPRFEPRALGWRIWNNLQAYARRP